MKIVAGIVIGLIAGIVFTYYFYVFTNNKLISDPGAPDSIPMASGYRYKNVLACKIIYSSNQKEINDPIIIQDILSSDPTATFKNGITSPMKKIFENVETLVIQLIATGSGSVDTIVIDKATGIFSRASSGSFAGSYAIAYRGNCQ